MAYSWLFEVLVHGLYEWLGLAGIVAYRALMSYAILASLHRFVARREPRFVVATSLVGIAFFAMLPLLNERTWLFTILFSTLTLDVILDLRRGVWTWIAWWLPVIFAFWANVHIQFVYGLFLLALGCARAADRWVSRTHAGAGPRLYCGDTRVVEAPRAHRGLPCGDSAEPLSGADLPGRRRVCNEVGHIQPRRRAPGLGLSDALGMGHARPGRRGGLRARAARRSLGVRGTPAGVASFLALRARRDVWFAVLAALAVLSTGHRWDAMAAGRFALSRSRPLVIAAMVGAVLVATGWCLDLSTVHLQQAVAENYPARAAAVVEQRGYRGPLFNEYGWGSYLIWRLPALPVSIDGRADLHGPERIRRNVETISGLRGWDTDSDLLAANAVIIRTNAALASLLRLDPRFELVHEDPVAAVFLRRPRTGA